LFIRLFNSEKLYRLEGRIIPDDDFPIIESLGQNSRVYIDQGLFSSYIQDNGRFILHDIPKGNYSLKVSTNLYQFQMLRVDIGHTPERKVVARILRVGGDFDATGPEIGYPIRMSPISKYDYFTLREGFNFLGILSSPMMLMSLVSLILVFFAPKMMNNLDEETLKEVQETQSTVNGFLTGSKLQEGPSISERLAKMMTEKP